MSRPEWKDAPEWASYCALDANGEWYWYEFRPEWDGSRWNYTGSVMMAWECDIEASESLEERP